MLRLGISLISLLLPWYEESFIFLTGCCQLIGKLVRFVAFLRICRFPYHMIATKISAFLTKQGIGNLSVISRGRTNLVLSLNVT